MDFSNRPMTRQEIIDAVINHYIDTGEAPGYTPFRYSWSEDILHHLQEPLMEGPLVNFGEEEST